MWDRGELADRIEAIESRRSETDEPLEYDRLGDELRRLRQRRREREEGRR